MQLLHQRIWTTNSINVTTYTIRRTKGVPWYDWSPLLLRMIITIQITNSLHETTSIIRRTNCIPWYNLGSRMLTCRITNGIRGMPSTVRWTKWVPWFDSVQVILNRDGHHQPTKDHQPSKWGHKYDKENRARFLSTVSSSDLCFVSKSQT